MTEMRSIAPIEQSVLDQTDCSDLRKAVEQLAEQYCGALRSSGAGELRRLARRLGVRAINIQNLPCDGLLLDMGDEYEIQLNGSASAARRRFSLAHEIAHIILHIIEPATRTTEARGLLLPSGHRAEERICDMLAASILMPERSIRNAFCKESPSLIGEIDRLSSLYRTSFTAMAIRLQELALIGDIAVLNIQVADNKATISRVLKNFARNPVSLRKPWRVPNEHPAAVACRTGRSASGLGWIGGSRVKRLMRLEANALTAPSAESSLVLATSAVQGN